MSAVNVHEVLCVMGGRHGQAGAARAWNLLAVVDAEIAPFDEAQLRAAAVAFDHDGNGLNSKSSFNLADRAAYALAKTMNAPLLFKGNDFTHNDIARA